jgi:LuxR family transcriptional regulator, maltose regulon positive regulatory protein
MEEPSIYAAPKVVFAMAVPTRDTPAWFAATKLHPPLLRSDTIRRPHLEESLCRSVASLPLTLLSAPAGYGKTTILAALPCLLPELPLAWITLDAEDNDPVRFIGLLAAALQRLHPDCGRSVWPRLAGGSADGSGLKQAMSTLINDVETFLPAPCLLVLDDLHSVTEPAVHVALAYLLEHQPPQLHIAVGTRHDPPLRLARLAARRQLAELRRSDLGFSQAEAGLLLNGSLGLSLTATEVATLQARTEGWPAGLCLLAGPLGRITTQDRRTQFMAAVTFTERYALDFLTDEVLHDLPADLRTFLMQTSVLAEMTPSACRAVTGRADAGEVLETLYRQNLTIAAIGAGAEGEPVYRHHALFARLLARQLERELPAGELAELHRRAAGVVAAPGRAIAHYLSAGLWEGAAALMVRHGAELLRCGMSETVRSWYSALPEAARSPHLVLLMGACEIHRGDYAAADLLFRQAGAAFAAAGDAEGEGEAVSAAITIALQNDDRVAAVGLVSRALSLPLRPMGRARALLTRAWLHLADGDWAAIQSAVGEALAIPGADLVGFTYMSAPLIAAPGCLTLTERYCAEAGAAAPPGTVLRLGADELSAWCLLLRGRTEEARGCAEAAEALRQRLGGMPVLGNDAPLLLAVLALARGDQKAAGRAVEALLQRVERAPRSRWMLYLHAAGRTCALLGRRTEAAALLQRLRDLPGDQPLTRYLRDHLAGLLALLEGRRADAAAGLNSAAGLEAELPVARVGGSARLLQARLLLEQGRAEAAATAAARVVSEWEQAGTPGCALLDGPAIRPVLGLGVPAGAAAAAALAEPLTQRECDVLTLIVAGRTNRQMGEELYITEETVKSHVAHILRKLDVTSRTQAAIRGRELGL